MKRLSVIASVVLVLAVSGCGNAAPAEKEAEPVIEETGGEVTTESCTAEGPETTTLGIPQVKDGVMQPGEEAVEVHFVWDPVEGADGYEVSAQTKYYAEKEYREPAETVETTDTLYVDGAQDYFDFRIKVRAFKGNDSERVYGDWSSFAEGSAYEKTTLTAGGPLGELSVTFPDVWNVEVSTVQDEKLVGGNYGFIITPDISDGGHLEVFCSDSFGVCGTGLKSEEIELAGQKAHVGTYDDHENWDFIIIGEDKPQIIVQSIGCESWMSYQWEEAMAVLDTLKLDTSKTEG